MPVPNAEMTLIMVDKAVLSLTDYQIPNPITSFNPSHHSNVVIERVADAY